MLLVAEDPRAIRLDPELLKTLASDTRREILRALQKRRMTVSELSKQLGIGKPTVLEHVRKLDAAGLVRRLEDDRLWVYYELTDLGARMSGKGAVSVFLVLGISIGVLALGLMLVLGVMQFVGTVPFDGQDDAAFDVHVVQQDVFAEAREGFVVQLTDDALAEQGDWFARFEPVDQDQATVASVVQGAPEGNDTLRFAAPERLDSGTYTLRVTSPSGRTATSDEPVQVHTTQLAMTAPRWWQQVDGPAEVRVWLDGLPADGALVATTEATNQSLRFAMQNGVVALEPAVLDALPAGPLRLTFAPAQANVTIDSNDQMQIVDPRMDIAPLRVVGGAAAATNLLFAGHTDAPTFVVKVDGKQVTPEAEAPGLFRVPLPTTAAGGASGANGPVAAQTSTITVGRAPPVELTVLPALQATLQVQQDSSYDLIVGDADGAAVNVTIRIDGRTVGHTGSNGSIALDRLVDGTHRLDLVLADGTTLQRTVQVQGDTILPAPSSVRVRDVRFADTAGNATMSFTLDNEHLEPANVTVLGVGLNQLTMARSVYVGTAGTIEYSASGAHLFETDRLEVRTIEDFRFDVQQAEDDPTSDGGSAGGGAPTSSPTATSSPTGTTTPWDGSGWFSYEGTSDLFGQQVDAVSVDPPEPPATAPDLGDDEQGESAEDAATPTPAVGSLLATMLLVAVFVARRRFR